MSLLDELLAIDTELAQGDGATYRHHLAEDALVVVPGAVLDLAGTATAMDASPGWDEFTLTEARLGEPAPDVATIVYRFHGRRGDEIYSAVLSSTYVRRDGRWRLVLHQHTPVP